MTTPTATVAYKIPEPRTLAEVFQSLVPKTSTFTPHRLFDAMRALCQFPDPQFAGLTVLQPAFPVGRKPDGTLTVLGHRASWTESEANATVTEAFGPDAVAEVRHFVATYRTEAVDACDDTFMLAIAIIVWGGATKADDWMAWSLHDLEGTDGKGLGHLAPAYWIARWGKESLNALIAAGYTYQELHDTYGSETLPDPTAVATLIALRAESA